jgi:hypothetical protein
LSSFFKPSFLPQVLETLRIQSPTLLIYEGSTKDWLNGHGGVPAPPKALLPMNFPVFSGHPMDEALVGLDGAKILKNMTFQRQQVPLSWRFHPMANSQHQVSA